MTARSRARRARTGGDGGFTLPELLISIVILSFVAGAIGFALTVSLRNTKATADRSLSSLGGQTLSAWFAGDVGSTLPVGGADTTPTGTSGCPGTDPGENVLTLERADGSGRFVSYRLVSLGTDPPSHQLVRVSCPTGVRIVNVVGQGIADRADVVVEPAELFPAGDTGPGSAVGVVRLTVSIGNPNPVSVTVSGTVRDEATLDTPCRLVNVTPRTLGFDDADGDGSGPLLDRTPVNVNVAGNCGTMRLQIDDRSLDVELQDSGPERFTDLDPGSGWTERAYDARVVDDRGFSASFSFWATAKPCTVTSIEPEVLEYRPLGTDQPFTVVTDGPCRDLGLSFAKGNGSDAPALVDPVDGTTWRVMVSDDMAGWTPGRKVLKVTDDGLDIGRLALTATPAPCRFVSATTDLPPRTDASARLLYDLQLRITTEGVCEGVGLRVPTGVTEPPVSVDPIAPAVTGGPVTWTATLTRCASQGNPCPGQKWVPGTRDVTVVAGGDVLATFPLEILEVCSMIGTSPGTVTLGVDRRLAAPTPVSITTRGTCGRVSLSVPTGIAPDPLAVDLVSNGANHTRSLQPCDARWNTGARNVSVLNDGQPIGSFSLSVDQGPTVVTGTPLIVVAASGPRRVVADTPITVNNVYACGETVQVRYPTGTNQPTTVVVPLNPGAGNTMIGTIRPADALWTTDIVNPRTATVTVGGRSVGTYLFVVSDCVVTTTSDTVNVNSANRVANNQRIEFQTAGSTCRSTMTIRFTPPGPNAERTLSVNQSSGNNYRTSDLRNTPWTDGQSTIVTVYNSTTTFDASTLAGTFTVTGT